MGSEDNKSDPGTGYKVEFCLGPVICVPLSQGVSCFLDYSSVYRLSHALECPRKEGISLCIMKTKEEKKWKKKKKKKRKRKKKERRKKT